MQHNTSKPAHELMRKAAEGEGRLSFGQQWMWKVCRFLPDNSAFHIPYAFQITGPLDRKALRKSLVELLSSDRVLTSSFPAVDGVPTLAFHSVSYDLVLEEQEMNQDEGSLQKRLEAYTHASFDLEAGPLYRFVLFRMDAERHVLLFVFHHIVYDYDSIPLLLTRLSALYRAAVTEEPNAVEPPPFDYYDYTVSQLNSSQETAYMKADLDYWSSKLGDPPSVLQLPSGKSRPAIPDMRGGRHVFRIARLVEAEARQTARQHGADLFTVMLSALYALLYRYTGQHDIAVGNHVSGRKAGEQGVIGLFLETLVLRMDMSGNPTLLEVVEQARTVTDEAYRHRTIPFELLVGELVKERNLSHAPLFQVMFTINESTDGEELALVGSSAERLDVDFGSAKFDLSFGIMKRGEELLGTIEYAADLFEPESIAQMANHYMEIVETYCSSSGQCTVADIALSPPERRRPETRPLPISRDEFEETLTDRFEWVAAAYPERTAVRTKAYSWTYSELDTISNRVAASVLGEPAVGDVVALLFDHDAPLAAGIIGALKAGKTYVALDPHFPPARLAYILSDSGATAILSDGVFPDIAVELTDGLRVPVLTFDFGQLPAVQPMLPPQAATADTTAYILYTSGSTGEPKGIVQNHRNVLHHMRTYTHHLGIRPDDRLSLVSSYSWDAGLMDVLGALLSGAGLYPFALGKSGLDEMANWIVDEQITVLHVPVPVYRSLLDSESIDRKLRFVRLVVLGGDFIRQTDVESFNRCFSPDSMLVNAYGPTESTTCLLNVGRHGHQVERHTFPLGYPVDRTEVTLVNEAGIQEAVYGIGEIRIQSEYVALGYWRRDDLTREKFIQSAKGDNNIRSYCTGDIGRWLPDGRIEFVGRRDFQVKIRGYRVELGEIEAVLAKHPGIQDAVAVAKRADPDQYRLVAYYVSKDNVWIAPGELREYMSGLLPDFMVPALCLELGQLSLTPTRKIDRRSLPEPDWSVLIESRLYEPPKDATERLFVELWAELLGLEPDRIGVEDDFFELGGDSLLCLRCLSRARARGIVIAPSQFIKLRTIRRIAEVANTSVAESAAAEDSFFSNVVPLLPTQVYVTSCANPHFFNGAIMLKPLGQLSAECVKSAFMIVINYHEGLRQKFVNEQEGWQSIISEPLEQFDLDYLDLRSVREDEQEKAFERYAENRQPGFDLSRPPLIRATIVDYGSGKQRLFILYHTLLMDLYGQLIFLEDFVQAYEQLLNGEPVRLAPKSASYPSWTGRMKAFASQEQTLKEMEYWTALPWSELAEPWPDVPEQYPAGFPNNRMLPRFPDVHKETVALDMSQTGILLKRLPRQHGVQIDDILLSAYAYAISNWTGGTAVLFDYIVSGRILPIADLDISRTIGPAACSIPVVMRIGESDPIAALLSASKQLQAIPNEKIGFHIFRQYSVDEEARSILNAFPLPNFSFKYNGGFDKREPLKGLFDYSNEKTGESGSREHLQKHRYLIRTNTGLSEDGTFTADFIYNANLLNADTVRSVAQSFIKRLRLLCASEVDGAIMNDDRMGGRRG